MSRQELITFQLLGKLFAVSSDNLVEVLEPVSVSPLPLVPEFIDGLVNVGGEIIPQIDLAKFLHPEQDIPAQNLETLLVVELAGNLFALKVNEIQETLSIDDADESQVVEQIEGELGNANLSSLKVNDIVVNVFQLESLSDVVRASNGPEQDAADPSFLGELEQKKQDEELFREFLLVDAAGVDYAIALTDVYDVVDVDTIHKQPNSPEAMLGIALVRERPRLILSLSELLGMDGEFSSKATGTTIVIVERKKALYGLAVDEVKGLDHIAESQISFDQDGHMLSVLRGEAQLVTEVVTLTEVMDAHVLAELKSFTPDVEDIQEQRVKHVDLLRFAVDQTAYAISIKDVKRIIYNKKIEPLLEPQSYLMGTIEFEGSVIPVVNLFQQLGGEALPGGPDSNLILETEFIVVTVNKSDWALLVDRSDQIIEVPEALVDQVKHDGTVYVSAFAVVEEQLLSVLNVSAICKANNSARFRLGEGV